MMNPFASVGWPAQAATGRHSNPNHASRPQSDTNGQCYYTLGAGPDYQPSILGALPTTAFVAPPKVIRFIFESLNPTILNCTVLAGVQRAKCLEIVTHSIHSPRPQTVPHGVVVHPHIPSASVGGMVTEFWRAGYIMARIEWQSDSSAPGPIVEIREVLKRQYATQFLALSKDKKYTSMRVRGKSYAWVSQNESISLFTSSASPDLLAKVSSYNNSVSLSLTTEAINAGVMEAAIVATVLMHSGSS